MPILKKEDDIYPADLLQNALVLADQDRRWYCLYTISRREKDLIRKLVAKQICCYLPIVPKRFRSPAGRLRTSFIPLFHNYAFLFANEAERLFCLTTNCISRIQEVKHPEQLVRDLSLIQLAIGQGTPLTAEARIEPGQRIRVRSGPFQGYEGQVIRREGKTRLLLSIQFLEQSVSMEVDEAVLEIL